MTDEKQPIPLADLVGVYKPAAKAEELEVANEPKGPVEIGGPKGPEPTRYGDWEKKGRCIDF